MREVMGKNPQRRAQGQRSDIVGDLTHHGVGRGHGANQVLRDELDVDDTAVAMLHIEDAAACPLCRAPCMNRRSRIASTSARS